MKYPELVPDWVCKVPIVLTIESEGITEDGEPASSVKISQNCNYQDGGRVVYTVDHRIVEVSGRAYFNGDILPGQSNITGGYAEIFGETREILQGFKRRNPDGSINYTEVHFR